MKYIKSFENSLQKKLFYTKESKISGFGNFAKIDLKPETNLGIGLLKIKNTGNPDKDFYRYDICTYTNHSNDPNIYFKKENNAYYFYTLKHIKKDEELTINYNLFDFEGVRDFI